MRKLLKADGLLDDMITGFSSQALERGVRVVTSCSVWWEGAGAWWGELVR